MNELPTFSDATAGLTAFLAQEDAPKNIVWIRPDDVTNHRRLMWVRIPEQHKATRHAESLYEAARRQGLGVSLSAVYKIGDSTACYVWAPKDAVDAEYAIQPRSLKYLVAKPLPTATEVRSCFQWFALRLLQRVKRAHPHSFMNEHR